MSRMNDLAYDIEQLYIEGNSAKSIARQLGCPLYIVEDWIKAEGLSEGPGFVDVSGWSDEEIKRLCQAD